MLDVVSQTRVELLPLLRSLCDLVAAAGEDDQREFFRDILRGVENAQVPDDLADPLRTLSASGFVGFDYDPLTARLLDHVLIAAQRFSLTTSVSEEVAH